MLHNPIHLAGGCQQKSIMGHKRLFCHYLQVKCVCVSCSLHCYVTYSHSLPPLHTHTHTYMHIHTHTVWRVCMHLPQLGLFSFNIALASAKPQISGDGAANLTESTHTHTQNQIHIVYTLTQHSISCRMLKASRLQTAPPVEDACITPIMQIASLGHRPELTCGYTLN